jgi:hypothetical protein
MTMDEKLDELHHKVERLFAVGNESAGRGNKAFANITSHLAEVGRQLAALKTAIEGLRRNRN